jgi:hypothetical protein
MSKNTVIDGIAASEHLDSSGESLSIEGMDISSLGGPDSILNWEHGSKDRPSQVVGKVTFARKIMKKSDAKNKREVYFWNKIKKPFVYIKAELFDGLGHSGAQDVAAMLKYKNKDKGKNSRLVVGFSIEGGKIEKKGMQVTKSIARDVAITVKPCNKVCDAELIEGDFDDDFLYKNQSWDCEILSKGEILTKSISYRNLIVKDIKKNGDAVEAYQKKYNQIRREGGLKENKKRNSKKKEIEKLANKKINTSTTENTWNSSEKNNMRKALIAGVMSGTPDSLTGGAALAEECLEGKIQNTSKPKKNKKKIDKSIKKGQAPIQFTQLAGKSKPQSEVPILSNPMQAARFQKELGDDVPSSSEGMAMVTGQGKRRAISMEPSQTQKEMAQTKGRGNFPTAQYHEGFHDHINKIDQKYPELKDHTQSLMRYALDNFFHPQDRGSMLKYLKDTQGYKENVNEEALAHFSDFRTSPSLRNNFNTFHDLGKKGNLQRQTRIKSSMKKLNNWANTVGLDDMKKIHANYQKKDAIAKLPIEKQKEMVKPERFKPGESGLNPKKIAASEK